MLKICYYRRYQSNSDLQNLMVVTEIATFFLDLELRIKRYTPHASELFNLMPTDPGRPIGYLRSRLKYERLEQDAQTVATHLTTIQIAS
jgi:two-component system, chemotaxis family, CheB/CheR fusion protein